MIEIDSKTFFTSLTYLSGALGEYKLLLSLANGTGQFTVNSSTDDRAQVLKSIKNLQDNCALHGLKTSEKMAAITFKTCLDALAGNNWFYPANLRRTVTAIEGLLNTAVLEAESRKFFLLAADASCKDVSADTLFGMGVIDAFPNSAFDISEAGKCLSFGLWTAGVMHSMRIIEIGLHALARHVGVEPSDNWNKTLNEIEASLRKISKRTDGNEAEQQAAEAGTHLRFIKNAWRNQAMHHISKYNEQEATEIFNNTRSFMKHIAAMTY